MPKIPTYDIPQVQPQVPGIGGVGGGATGKSGLEYLGEGLDQLAAGMRQANKREDDIQVQQATDSARKQYDDILQDTQQVTGKNIYEPDPSPNGDLNTDLKTSKLQQYDETTQIDANQLSPQARERFLINAGRIRDQLDTAITAHLNQQENIAYEDAYKDTHNTELSHIFNFGVNKDGQPQWDVINDSIGRMEANAAARADKNGKDIRIAEDGTRAEALATVITRMKDRNNPEGALAIFNEHKTELDPKFQMQMENDIKTQIQAKNVKTDAIFIMSQKWPLGKALDEVDNLAKDKPEYLDALRSEVGLRYSNKDKIIKASQDDATGALWSLVFPADGSRQKISINDSILLMSDVWNSLPDGGAALKKSMMEYQQRMDEISAGVKPLTEAEKVSRYALYQRILDKPNELIKMNDNQISTLTPILGPDMTAELMKKKRDANNNIEQLKAATLNDIKFSEIVGEFGVTVKGKLSKEQNAKLGMIRESATQAIAAEQLATGKLLLPERKQEILRKLLTTEITSKTGVLWDSKAPIYYYKTIQSLPATDEEKKAAIDYLTAARSRAGVGANVPLVPMDVWELIQALRDAKAARATQAGQIGYTPTQRLK